MIIAQSNSKNTPDRFTHIPLKNALEQIKSGFYAKLIDNLPPPNTPEYKTAKGNLPVWAFAGEFGNKIINNEFKKSNGLFHIDIDGLSDNVEQAFHELAELPEMFSLWRSPSGNGLKGLIRVPDDLIHCDADYKKAFAQVKQYILKTGYKIDESCKDVRRLCFVCSDSAIYINESAIPFNFDPEIWNAEPQKPHVVSNNNQTIQSHDNEQTLINRCTVMILNAAHGTIHNSRVKAGRLAGGFIAAGRVNEHSIIAALERASAFVGSQYGDNQAALEVGYKAIFDGIQYGKAQPIQKTEWHNQQVPDQQYQTAVNSGFTAQAMPVSNVVQFQQPSGITPFSDLSPEQQTQWTDDDEPDEPKPVFKSGELPIKHIGAICDFINSGADAYNHEATKHGALTFIAHAVGRTVFSSTGDKCNLMIGNISSKGDLAYINNGLELLFDAVGFDLHKTVRANRVTHPQLMDFYHDKNAPRKLTFMPFSLGGDIKSSLRQTSNALSDIYAEIQQLHTKPVHTVYDAKNKPSKVFKPLLNCYANFTENDLFFFGKCSNAGGLFPLFINNLSDGEFIGNTLKRDPDTNKQSFVELKEHLAVVMGKTPSQALTPSGRTFSAEPISNIIHWDVEPHNWQPELKSAIGSQHTQLFSSLQSQFIKLSVIVAAWNGEQIVSEQLADACCNYLCIRVQAVLEALAKRSSDDVAVDVYQRVLAIIHKAGGEGVTAAYLTKCCSGFRKLSTMERNDLINSMVKSNDIYKKTNEAKKGRPGERYFIK
jgi:hypothetical protein